MYPIRWSGVLLFVVFLLAGSLGSTPAVAQRMRGGMRVHRHAAVVVNLPREHVRLLVGGREFFYARGVFYRTGPRGYLAIAAPIGARIKILPEGYTSVVIGGGTFYSYYGTYYRYDPVEKLYVVTNPPEQASSTSALTLDRLTLVDGTTVDGTFIGGTKSTIQIDINGDFQEYPIEQIVSITFAPPGPN